VNNSRDSHPASFLVIGNPRSGLSSVHHALSQHPKLQVISSGEKAHFADDNAYAHGNPPRSIYESGYKNLSGDLIRGEVTSSYLSHPFAISRIHRYNPDIKLIVILRNPAMRTYSHWQEAKSRGLEKRSFAEIVHDACSSSLSQYETPPSSDNYIAQSLYSEQVSHIQQYFGPHQILCLRTEDLKEDAQVALYRMYQFIGVPYLEVDVPAQNVGSYAQSIEPKLYQDLSEHHRSDIRALESLVGWDCKDWTAPLANPASSPLLQS